MKILYVYPFCSLGGVEISIVNKMQALKKVGIDSEAILLNIWNKGGNYLLNNSSIKANLNINELIDMLRKDFDIITIIDFPKLLYIIDRLNINKKIIYETHCSTLREMKISYSIMKQKKISAIIVPSQFNKEMIEKITNIDKNIFVLPNPIDINIFSNIPTAELNFYKGFINKKNIIWIGRLERNKNPINFIKMGNILLQSNKDLNFIIIGNICGDLNYFQLIKSNIPIDYISNYTFFYDIPNERMPEIYSLAANTGGCLVSTSENESLPMIFLEAMACKCPVVSPNVGGIGELIRNNLTGKIYESNNINDGCKAIKELIDKNNITIRDKIIKNSYELVIAKHSIDKISVAYNTILYSIFNEAK
ncbi:glycosyltransferase family 4 protein [Clostridium estertheticum]|uniref:glycosyltransferase family 4 protein n=1 Tax=Clostridium estertheticum TaxID=238834 RepID=UPI001C6DEB42|nr:glycosyltransferase family 4 protein [Clostridium estertheticum]MBW9152828.1 glycosyltransferase family 4 protein [Clostridium estertheticum]WLC85785.1 glycosyltransferase family 4 protein [Clostridium estertheticum]